MMEIIEYSQDKIDKISREIAEYIREGKIVAIPTDTCYGIAANATNPKAVRKVFEIKKRPKTRPISVFLDEKHRIEKYAHLNEIGRKVMELFPDRITIIFPAKKSNVVEGLIVKNKTIGIRIPPFKLPRLIVKYAGAPITATSANIYGEPPIYDSSQLKILKGIDYIVDMGKLPMMEVSTVIDISKGRVEILREGVIKIEDLKKRIADLLNYD